jgi:hypothetical protein
MASNEIPVNLDQLFTLAEDAADGLHTYEVTIGIKQNKEADVRLDLTAARTGSTDYDNSRSAKTALSTAATVADSNGKAYLGAARKILALKLGEQWSDLWLPTGFPNLSTAVPASSEERQSLLFALKDYFTANPANEVAALNVTAAQAGLLANALSAARSAVNDGINLSGQKKNVRDDAVSQLRKRLRGLVNELGQLLHDDDPRWNAFGFNLPAAPNTPDVPDAPVLTAGAPGTVLADWADSRRADHYRVWKQIVGVDADFVATGSPVDSDLTLTGLAHGATVKICVSAVNAAGESQKSDPAQIVVP